MAVLSNDKTYVTVEKGDNLWKIVRDILKITDNSEIANKVNSLAAINNLSNPDYIVVGQKIKLVKSGSSSSTSSSSKKVTIKEFGLQSDAENTLLCTWDWSQQSVTENYAVMWEYVGADGVWFVGNDGSVNYKYSVYQFPATAKKVRFKVMPVSKKKTVNNKETTYFTAKYSTYKYHTVKIPPAAPSALSVTVAEDLNLTASVTNIDEKATLLEFDVVKDDTTWFKSRQKVKVTDTYTAEYSCKLTAGGRYKVRCRAYGDGVYGDWSEYSPNYETAPSAPSKFTKCVFSTKTSVYLEWGKVENAESYTIEYTTKKSYFDSSNELQKAENITTTQWEIMNLDSGNEYFFRIKAVNSQGSSGWSEISSAVIGTIPSAPTTWSSSSTVVAGEPLILYWVHNSEDNSTQTYATIELITEIDGVESAPEQIIIKNENSEKDKDKNLFYEIDTAAYEVGAKIRWKVCTAGIAEDVESAEDDDEVSSGITIGDITKVFGDWSVERVVDIYAQPYFEYMKVTNSNNEILGDPGVVLESFPIRVSALTGPNTQRPIGYHVSITANAEYGYDTVDNLGNDVHISKGQEVYSKYFDIDTEFDHEISAGDVTLENDQEYTLHCIASMNSGLNTPTASTTFTVAWSDTECEPNAELGFDSNNVAVSITPYCEITSYEYRKVTKNSDGTFTATTQVLDGVYGAPIEKTYLSTGEQVYSGVSDEGESVYYYICEESEKLTGYYMSVYRREYDGSFTLIGSDIDSSNSTTVVDPHPALDYARYRIVAMSKTTGATTYYDMPGYPIGEKSIIIQWDEKWSSYDSVGSADDFVEPEWTGSMIKLPYNIDVSDKYAPDVEFIEYTGRKHPVSYYGTHLGETSSWSVEIQKDDRDTLYALRRLAIWMGNAYVREPSGSGYWANVSVSFNQKHCELTIPVSLSITRVEGGA